MLLVARPLAVWLSLLPFISDGARSGSFSGSAYGAVPIVLALFPVIYDIDGAERFFEVAYVVVIISLLIQGSSVPLAARLLKVEALPVVEPRHRADLNLPIEPSLEIVQFVVTEKFRCRRAWTEQHPLRGCSHTKTIAFASSPTTSFA